jgi:hypothetical protein
LLGKLRGAKNIDNFADMFFLVTNTLDKTLNHIYVFVVYYVVIIKMEKKNEKTIIIATSFNWHMQ